MCLCRPARNVDADPPEPMWRLSVVDAKVRALITAAIRELGLDTSESFVEIALLRGGYFVGWRFKGDAVTAVWLAGTAHIRVQDRDGTELTTINLPGVSRAA